MSNPFLCQGDKNLPSYHKPHLLQHAGSLDYSASGRKTEEEFDSICNEQTFRDQVKSFSYHSFPNLDEQLQNSNKSFLNFCHHGEHDEICVDNHITASSVYQAYRNRQTYRSSDEELIWPPNLEAFLFDALMDVPHMGRHKYTLNGKPHGRNELISLYIQIAYQSSLPPGETPDPRMSRDRKQVSSHIQVLKNLVEKQAYKPFHLIFQSPELTSDDRSFEKNPCLIALSQGSLPDKAYRDEVRRKYLRRIEDVDMRSSIQTERPTTYPQIRPENFWSLAMPIPEDQLSSHLEWSTHDENMIEKRRVADLQAEKGPGLPDPISGGIFVESPSMNHELHCLIIQLHVLLNLSQKNPEEDLKFLGNTVLSLSDTQPDVSHWKIFTSFVPPMESYSSHQIGKPLKVEVFSGEVLYKSSLETRISVPFPADRMCIVLSSLSSQKSLSEGPVEKATMCQMIYCNSGSDPLGYKRAVIFWTFGFQSNIQIKSSRTIVHGYMIKRDEDWRVAKNFIEMYIYSNLEGARGRLRWR